MLNAHNRGRMIKSERDASKWRELWIKTNASRTVFVTSTDVVGGDAQHHDRRYGNDQAPPPVAEGDRLA